MPVRTANALQIAKGTENRENVFSHDVPRRKFKFRRVPQKGTLTEKSSTVRFIPGIFHVYSYSLTIAFSFLFWSQQRENITKS